MTAVLSGPAAVDLPCPPMTCSPQGQPFLPTFLGLEKSRAPGGARPAGFDLEILTSPVPAGSRVIFFARPKKVTKEKTDLAVAGTRMRGPLDEIAAGEPDLLRIFVRPG